MDEIFASFRFQ